MKVYFWFVWCDCLGEGSNDDLTFCQPVSDVAFRFKFKSKGFLFSLRQLRFTCHYGLPHRLQI